MTEKDMMGLVEEVKEAVSRAALLKVGAKSEEDVRAGMEAAAEAINLANKAIERVLGQLGV